MSQDFSWPSSNETIIGGPVTVVQPDGALLHTTVDNFPAEQDVNLNEVGGVAFATGQETSALSLPVVIASDQSPVPVSISSSVIQDINLDEYGGIATTLGQKTSSASIPVVIASDDTVAISAASLPLPTGAATSDNQTNGAQVTSVSNFPATQPVSGTVTANQGTANATPWNDNIAQWGGAATSLGQKTSAASVPVVIASDQSAIPVTVSSFPTEQNVNLNEVGGTAFALGQTTESASIPVTIASDQSSIPSYVTTPTALTIYQAAITVGTTAVRLTVSGSAPASTRVVLVGTPDTATAGTVTFYIGSSTVTNSGATRGVEIAEGQSFIANNDAGDYWIVASAASQTVTVMEQY